MEISQVIVFSEKHFLKIPSAISELADSICSENHNILNPKVYSKHKINASDFLQTIKEFVGASRPIDAVLFSAKSGAEPHIDKHLKHLDTYTYIIPVRLGGRTTLNHSGGSVRLAVGIPVRINHQELHSMVTENSSGCVVIMASEIISENT